MSHHEPLNLRQVANDQSIISGPANPDPHIGPRFGKIELAIVKLPVDLQVRKRALPINSGIDQVSLPKGDRGDDSQSS